MASAILVVCLGRLHMREFQYWVASLRLDRMRHCASRRVPVTVECVRASLVNRVFPDPGEAHGLRSVQESGHYRRKSVGLGRNT